MSKPRYRLFSSLRFRLVLLVLLAILPAVGVVWHSSLEQRQHMATLEKEEALRLAHLMSHNYSHIIEGARHFLHVVAQLPTLRTCEPTSCNSLFSDLLKQYPWYLNIGAAHPDGNVFASAISMVKPVNIADRSYFQMALQTHKFSIGDYQIGRVVGKPVVNFGYPVLDDASKVKAIVYVAMDLDWLNKLSTSANLPPGSTVNVVNHNGMILAHHPHPEKWIGKTDSEIPVIKAILSQREGTIEAMGKDGVQRFYAFTPFGGTDQAGDIYVSVGLPAQVALAQLAKISTRSLILLGLICLLAIMAAMVGGKLLILRGLDPLVKAAKRLGAGDLSARTGIAYGKGEVSQLAATFDEMAGSLEQRESERKKNEDALRRSEENANRLVQEKAVIAEIGRIVSSTLNIEEVYERFAEETRKLILFDRVTVNLLDPKTDTVQVAYLSGPDVEGRRVGDIYPFRGSVSEQAIKTRSSLIVHAESQEDTELRFPKFLAHFQAGLRSMMLVPLISRDVAFGILHFQSGHPNIYTDEDCRLAESIGSQIAGAIVNSQLFADRKRAEQKLKESEERYRNIFNNAQVGLFRGRISDGMILEANLRAAQIFGYKNREECIRDYISSEHYLVPGTRERMLAEIQARGEVRNFEAQLSRKDGSICWARFSSRIYPGKGYIEGVIDDVTEEKSIAEALRQSEKDAKRWAEENSIIAEVSRIISSTLNIDEVYERFVATVRKLIPFDRISINLINLKDRTFMIPYVAGLDVAGRQEGDVIPLAGTAAEEVMRVQSSLLLANLEEFGNRFPGLLPLIEAGFQSMMLVPLISHDQVIGILNLQSVNPSSYTEIDLRLAEKIGAQIAGAIANAQLYNERKRAEEAVRKSEEKTKRLAQENAGVAEIGRIISSTLNIEEVYERFSEEVKKLIPVDRTAFTIINPKDRTATTAYGSGVEIPTRLPGEAFALAGSATEMAEQVKTGLIIPTENENEVAARVPGLLPVFRAGIRSVMMIPLISRDEVIGVLNLQSTKPKAYTEKELRIAERVGSQIAGAIANTQLFSEHKRAEEALQESEMRFRDLYDNAPLGYHEYDHEGRITNVNRRDLEMLGYTAEEMIGQFMWKFNVEEEIAQQQILEKLAGTRPPGRNLERTYRRKDGTTFPVLIEDRLILDGKGGIKGIRCTIQDITDRKRAEKEMADLQEQLHQSQKMEAIGCLAGGISHDFNNLLSIIIPYCQMALLDLKEIDPLRDTVEKIHKAGQRAADLTRQLLAFSRRQMMEMKVLDLNALLTDLNKMLHRLIGEDIELVYEFAEDLGRVKADAGQIEQIVLNLAVNARDAMPEGGKLTIETANVELDEKYAKDHFDVNPGPFVMLMVSDTGAGMTAEIREKIFEPFFTTKEKGKGTGLGLAVVYGIVKQSGGFIHVYSEPGMGTTFRIYFPRVDDRLEESKVESRKELLRGGETVLVVEDEGEVRKLAVTILRKQGYKVLEAGSGGEAILFGEGHENPIHLMVTDVVLPGMGGRVLAERLSPLHPEMKVLYMSGYTYNSIGHHGILEEGVHFIQKPFTLEGFTRKIREVLDQSERGVFS